jgi:signal transduction histidine kinase
LGWNLYLAVPLLAAVLAAGFGTGILMIGARERPNQVIAALHFGGAFWAGCEVLWNAAPDAQTALLLHRIAGPGWIFIGPLAVHLVCSVTEVRLPRLQRYVPALYALNAGFLLLAWTTDTMLARMDPVPWGYGMVPGSLFPLWSGQTALLIGLALFEWVRLHRRSPSASDRVTGARTGVLMTLPFVVGAASDIALPMFGVQVPRLGSLSCASIGGAAIYALRRYGFSMLDPGAFSQRVLATLPDGVALTSLNGRIRLANSRMDELLGCVSGGAVGLAIGDHLAIALPPGELREQECELLQVSGRQIPVAVSAVPMVNDDGSPQSFVLLVRDRREVAGLRLRLITSGRLAAVGQLAAGIAHEINNPLAFVRANLAHLRREWETLAAEVEKDGAAVPALAEWGSVLEESLEGVDRAAAIVRDVREFSHAGGEETELADLNAIVESALRMASPQLGAGVCVERAWGELPAIPCAPQRLRQLFLNLIVNAAQAVEGNGEIRLETRREADRALFRVRDDGHGIAREDLERIFDPFFTTKPAGKGTGLGLAICHEIARSHGGTIHVESELGRGTTVTVSLPLARPLAPDRCGSPAT